MDVNAKINSLKALHLERFAKTEIVYQRLSRELRPHHVWCEADVSTLRSACSR